MIHALPASNLIAPTLYITAGEMTYAYRRFGEARGLPLLCLQHFTGTLDGWDPAATDPLARGREVVLFESTGIWVATARCFKLVPEAVSRQILRKH